MQADMLIEQFTDYISISKRYLHYRNSDHNITVATIIYLIKKLHKLRI